MISDKLFDELFPIGYWWLSYTKEPPQRGKWKCLGIYRLTAYIFERIG